MKKLFQSIVGFVASLVSSKAASPAQSPASQAEPVPLARQLLADIRRQAAEAQIVTPAAAASIKVRRKAFRAPPLEALLVLPHPTNVRKVLAATAHSDLRVWKMAGEDGENILFRRPRHHNPALRIEKIRVAAAQQRHTSAPLALAA
ncbi:MAG TPA: hypothetical protein VFQ72_04285 [Candidatus Paceibacterota bacterium]|nr:hypothetical protein [Candidatus Paceibacterota bacterium]